VFRVLKTSSIEGFHPWLSSHIVWIIWPSFQRKNKWEITIILTWTNTMGLFGKSNVAYLVTFPVFYGVWKFVTIVITDCYRTLSWVRWIQPTCYFFKFLFNIILPSISRSPKLPLSFRFFH
jgi:hypothetical protein